MFLSGLDAVEESVVQSVQGPPHDYEIEQQEKVARREREKWQFRFHMVMAIAVAGTFLLTINRRLK